MSSKLIGILSVGAALAHTEIGAVRERARAEPRELRDGLRGEVGREHTAVAPRSVTPSCQSCHRADIGIRRSRVGVADAPSRRCHRTALSTTHARQRVDRQFDWPFNHWGAGDHGSGAGQLCRARVSRRRGGRRRRDSAALSRRAIPRDRYAASRCLRAIRYPSSAGARRRRRFRRRRVDSRAARHHSPAIETLLSVATARCTS